MNARRTAYVCTPLSWLAVVPVVVCPLAEVRVTGILALAEVRVTGTLALALFICGLFLTWKITCFLRAIHVEKSFGLGFVLGEQLVRLLGTLAVATKCLPTLHVQGKVIRSSSQCGV